MHPSLRPDRLEELPASTKGIATSAARGSVSAVRQLLELVETKAIPETQVTLLLPAFYAALDPARIPTAALLDSSILCGSARSPAIGSAILSLDAFISLPKPDPSTYTVLWRSAWAWMEFLHTYKLHLRDLPVEEDLYFGFISTICHIQAEWDEELISSTPGIRAVIACCWVVLLKRPHNAGISKTCHVLFRDKKLVGTPWMDELIDGAGGTVDDLAATVVRHINIAITSEVPIGSAGIWMLLAIGNFLGNTTSSARDRGLDTPYEAALLTHGLVGALTKAICALNAVIATHSVGPPLLDKLLSLVGQRCLSPLGYHWITEALDAGLLRAITSSTTTKLDNVHGHLPYYLSSVVPNTLVYRSALVRMPKAMNDVQRLVETRAFRKSALYQPWLTFQEIVDDRIKFLSLFASGHYLCSQIHEKGNFKRCSGCLEFYYCSLNFQSLDLNSGHRRMCATYRNFRMRDVLDSRDLSFLRELAHVDFRRNLFEILYQIVDIMSLTGEPIMPMMTSMKYTGGKASVQVSPLHMIFPDPRLEDLMTRMHASRGRLALLHITVHEGAARSTRIFRLRFEDARLPDGALSLARSLPPGENARQAALEAGGGINEDTTGHRVLIVSPLRRSPAVCNVRTSIL